MRKPDFFVVGAAKSGTSAVWKYFQQHPNIFVTEDIANKELGYYSNQYGVSNEDYYLSHFKEAKTNQLIGEVCHAYLTSDESAQWIKDEIPNAKIIMILRNPIERAYSLYNWMVMQGYEKDVTFEKALEKENLILNGKYNRGGLTHTFLSNYLYFSSGLYYSQVKKYLEVFGENNVLIIEHGDFKKNQSVQLNRILKFLNKSYVSTLEHKQVNRSNRVISVKVQYFSRRILLSRYGNNEFLKSFFNLIMKLNLVKKTPKKIKPKTKENLVAKYRDDIISLSKLCCIDFDKKWLF